MMVEAFRRLEPVASLKSYRYVGFGSPYFPDFSLIHRSLGISTMVSIERELSSERRMCFNRPFKCISIEMGEAGEVLSRLEWNHRSIVWLDYDKPLDIPKIADVKAVASSAPSGSLIIVSVNGDPGQLSGRLERQRNALGSMFPFGVVDDDALGGWGTALLFRRVLDDQIRLALDDRNAGLASALQLHYKQFFNFHYQDGVRMLTVGGILFDESARSHVGACGLDDLGFTRDSEEAYLIKAPNLTLREVRHLDRQLPCGSPGDISADFLPEGDVASYFETYRYYPHFADVDA